MPGMSRQRASDSLDSGCQDHGCHDNSGFHDEGCKHNVQMFDDMYSNIPPLNIEPNNVRFAFDSHTNEFQNRQATLRRQNSSPAFIQHRESDQQQSGSPPEFQPRRGSVRRPSLLPEPWIFKRQETHLMSRSEWFQKSRILVDLQFAFMVIGLVLMVIENELYIQGVVTKTSLTSILMKSAMVLLTIALIVSIIMYEINSVKIIMFNRDITDWRVIMTKSYAVFIIIQILICTIQPVPGDITMIYYPINGKTREVSIDGLLSVLMLFRLFIVGRVIIHHSFFMSDICTRTLCALNKVQYDGKFIFKAMMSSRPAVMIFTIMLGNLVLGSFSMHVCESYYEPKMETGNILESTWIIAMDSTLLEPNSYCGRFVAVMYHLIATCAGALLIAVATSKLALTRAERYVSMFSMREKLVRKSSNAKKEIVKLMTQIWLAKRKGRGDEDTHIIRLQRKMHVLMRKNQTSKAEIRSIDENAFGLMEVHQSMNVMEEKLDVLQDKHDELNEKLDMILEFVQTKDE